MGDDAKQNPMKELQVEKLILNISVGTSGDPLEKARRVLKQLTGLSGGISRAGVPRPARCGAELRQQQHWSGRRG